MTVLVAIGGFKLHHWGLAPAFAAFAMPAFSQARKAPGCRFSATTTAYGRLFSLSAWEAPKAMRDYATSGAHKRALRAAGWLGSGPFAYYTSSDLPTWPEALEVWRSAHPEALSQTAPAG